jgi:hypothetical protein
MQFIERFFGISPDGGSGALELLLLLTPILAVGAFCLFRKSRHRNLAQGIEVVRQHALLS